MKQLAMLSSVLTLCVLTLVLAADASAARKLRASGFYRFDLGIGLPLQFALLGGEGTMANDTLWLGFPNPDPPIDGDLSVTGKTPANFTIPAGFITGSYSALLPLMGTTNVQITSMFSISRPASMAGAGVFGAGMGPGSFTFCPGSPPGLPGAACQAPPASPQGTGTKHGRLVYTGGGGFGGAAQALLQGTGELARVRAGFGFGSPIFQASHAPLGGNATFPVGGPAGSTSTATTGATPALVTQPRTAPTTNAVIPGAAMGPIVTSMNALTSCPSTPMGGAYPNIPLTGSLACVVGTGPPLSGSNNTARTATGFPFTTGTVLVQNTTDPQANGLITITGSDSRTPRGIGNISMVAGGLSWNSFTNMNSRQTSRITITFSEKTPSMTAGGIAAAAALMVLVVGYANRRRL